MQPRISHAVAALAVLLSLAALAQSEPRCALPKTGVFEKAGRLCQDDMPNSRSQCREFLDELASLKGRSLEQALALAFGMSFLASFDEDLQYETMGIRDERVTATAHLAGREVLKPFVNATPDDPMLLYAYSHFHLDDQEQYRALLRRVLALEPSCTKAALWLSMWPDPNDDAGIAALEHTAHGYKFGSGVDKLWFANRHHQALKYHRPDDAEAFRVQVAADMGLRDLPRDAESRADTLEVLCNLNALELRLETHCAAAIEVVAARARQQNMPLGADLLEAIGALSSAAGRGELDADGAGHLDRLGQLLAAEPEPLRSAQFHVVHSRLLGATAGVEAEVEALRRALDMAPRSGKIGLYLTGALERAGQTEQAKEVYRHIIANADGHDVEEGMPADHYAKQAAKYLLELEESR